MPTTVRTASALASIALAYAAALAVAAGPAAAAAQSGSSGASQYAGYLATSGEPYTSVAATWTVPTVTCTASDKDAAISLWTGLDGYNSSTVEQTGIDAECVGTTVEYVGWYELYPEAPVDYATTVKAGDVVTASVVYSAANTFVLSLSDTTEGWSKKTTKTLSGAARSSAEIYLEAPSTGPLPKFSTVAYSNCLIDGSALGSFDPEASNIVSATGTVLAQTSALTGGGKAYTVTWEHS